MKFICIFILFVTLKRTQEYSATDVSKEDIQKYRILRSLTVGHPFAMLSVSKQMEKPAVSDNAVGKKHIWINGIFRSSK